MQGRTALAAALVSAALCGCGQQTGAAPARIEITTAPVEATAPPPAAAREARSPAPAGPVRTGSRKAAQLVTPPTPAPAAPQGAATRAPARRGRSRPRRFRAAQLQVLRAHCTTRPAGDPRCVNGRVDERVAFAGLEQGR